MTDEKYTFIQDSKEKKIIAHSASKKRTHAGKGGKVRFPSDFLSKKELKAMNGEEKAYRLNEPMTWNQFKDMPDDIKILYVKLIREKFNAPDKYIGEALGVSRVTFIREIGRLGIGLGKKAGGAREWDQDGFWSWWNGKTDSEQEEETKEDLLECSEESPKTNLKEMLEVIPENETFHEVPEVKTLPVVEEKITIPVSGRMTFNDSADVALKTVIGLLGGKDCTITIEWELSQRETAVV